MAIRTKKTDPPNYLLDSRRSDLLRSSQTFARIFYSPSIPIIPPPPDTIASISLLLHPPPTHSALHRLPRLHPYLSSLPSPMLLYASFFLNGFYAGHMPCRTYVVRISSSVFPRVGWCDSGKLA